MMKKIIDRIFIGRAVDSALEGIDGGKGSGNFGHTGRPGYVGGSGNGRAGWTPGTGKGHGGAHYKGAFKHLRAPQIAARMTQAGSSEEAKAWNAQGTSARVAWADGFTPQVKGSKSAFKHYSWQGDRKMNALLRGGGVGSGYLSDMKAEEATIRKEIDKITEDISKHSTDKDIVLSRAISTTGGALAALGLNINPNDFHSFCKDGNFVDSLVGYTFRDDGFTSTTVQAGGVFTGPCTLEILAPKGTHGTYMAHDSKFPNEKEFLLQRGTQFAITSATYEGGQLKLQATIIDQTPQEIPSEYWTAPNIGSETVGVKKGYEPPAQKFNLPPKPTKKPKPAKNGKSANLAALSKNLEASGGYVTASDITSAYDQIGTYSAQSLAIFRRDCRKGVDGAHDKAVIAIKSELMLGHITPAQANDMYEYITHDTKYGDDTYDEDYWVFHASSSKKLFAEANWTSASDSTKSIIESLYPKAPTPLKGILANVLDNPKSSDEAKNYITSYLSKAYIADYASSM